MKCMDKHEFEQQNVFGTGAANTAYAKFFIGQSFLNPLTDPKTGLFLATLPLSPAAATTGISIMPKRAAGKFLFAPQARAGTRRKARKP